MPERDFYAEYVEMCKKASCQPVPPARWLTEKEFYKNFPDCKPPKK